MNGITYVIVDDCTETVAQIKEIGDDFQELLFVAAAENAQKGLDLILEHRPKLILLGIDSKNKENGLSLAFINILYKYLTVMPKIIVMSRSKSHAFEAIHYHVSGYLLKPIQKNNFIKAILPITRDNWHDAVAQKSNRLLVESDTDFISSTNSINKALVLCVKSYGDYRYLRAEEVLYFQADNNSTDIYLLSGEMITAFKTLKHFENLLQDPFYRIHNSFLINSNFISRIHTGSKLCTLRNTTRKIPFSKSYRVNIETIIARFSGENYIEF
ncbi:LytR/AlgR family response regulator transcription factor [Flavobacterium agrisoli]|uniref:LytTR family transcriptional regulator DNA-binding domain-containing protein n=1 Tax=Flavobacterium agrisoli TaxID=2793066 RepID=A0A934PM16_9FLAO|nr:LytTR family transcriptional regulator DNA-binding domain-containing protein [Flavobacterium agrisoli]MBK0369428.1 LytTR family transcriptional regulator DNA-binding domain-containing protein [Flavobacterium agrisoli]